MNSNLSSLNKLRSWRLFNSLAVIITVLMIAGIVSADLSTTEGVLFMIRYSVRCSLPWFLIAFTASSLQKLFPTALTVWLLSNRKYFGLAFAYGMLWQLFFIVWLITVYTALFFSFATWFQVFEAFVYMVLFIMALTSFTTFSRHISGVTWRVIHKTGMYLLWFIMVGTYIGYSFGVYPPVPPSPFIYMMATIFTLAWLIRIAAWMVYRFR